jgi:predicted dehydrogenase
MGKAWTRLDLDRRPLGALEHTYKGRNNMSSEKNQFTRRDFLRGTTLSTAAFMIVPGSVLGLRGATSPNSKLNVAGVGIGGQGASDLRELASENIVALCDVDHRHAADTFKRYSNAKPFMDYRQMLDEVKDIDGVVVATPDHMHAFVSMEAISRGKHVYCEKPLTHSVWEARQMAKAASAAKVATQMGNQGQASEDTRRLSEIVWSGLIGPVREAHIWTDRPSNGLFNEYWPQGVPRPKETPEVPSTLNWDLWLGSAPERPYHPCYHPFKWRGWWDFGTGALGDIGCHAMDPVFRALKLGTDQRSSFLHARQRGDVPAGINGDVSVHCAWRPAGPQLRSGCQRHRWRGRRDARVQAGV